MASFTLRSALIFETSWVSFCICEGVSLGVHWNCRKWPLGRFTGMGVAPCWLARAAASSSLFPRLSSTMMVLGTGVLLSVAGQPLAVL